MSVSILILTRDEENNLPGCLASVGWSDDVVVLDSFSTDRTRDIAERAGARVIQRVFDDWSSHQNWALESIHFKYRWVFYLDADERMTPDLAGEIRSIAADPLRTEVAFYCGRRNIFLGRWIKHAYPPAHLMRYFQPAHVRFERLVNPVPVIAGPHGYLRGQFLHDSFSKGMEEWKQKHERYAVLEAIEGLKILSGEALAWRDMISGDPAIRRKALKRLSFHLPLRGALKFMYLYFLSGGFLDGGPGLQYCLLQAGYEHRIEMKLRALKKS